MAILGLRWGSQSMTLGFPNRSRSYDPARRAVRFWGHDSAFEALFLVSEDALLRIDPGMPRDEAGILTAFDVNCDRIHAVAVKVYRRGHRGLYELRPGDF